MADLIFAQPFEAVGCKQCREMADLGFGITMAFQPIVHQPSGKPYAYEALVRGVGGEGAAQVLAKVTPDNLYRFDQTCRVKAIEKASELGLNRVQDCKLSINFLPNAVYRPATCIRATLEASRQFDFPADRLIFEVTEGERVEDTEHLKSIFREYDRQGFTTAIDDFGSGYSGLNLLAEFQPDLLKLDMALTRNLGADPVRQAIVAGIVLVARRLDILLVAEGVETAAECQALAALGIELMQGYYFARPEIEALPLIERLRG